MPPCRPTDDELNALFLYELFAAAGDAGTPPVSPEMAKVVRETVSPEQLAAVEHLYRAVKQAADEAPDDSTLDDLAQRTREILDRPH